MSGAKFSAVHEPLKETLDAGAESFLQDMVETEHFSGVVMVAQGGQILHRRAYNPRSDDYKIHAGSRLHVGSLGKQFTAAAILQQVEAGTVQLEGGINDFLPMTHRAEIWEGINVEHLLAHTSGIPDYALTRDYYDVVDGWAFGLHNRRNDRRGEGAATPFSIPERNFVIATLATRFWARLSRLRPASGTRIISRPRFSTPWEWRTRRFTMRIMFACRVTLSVSNGTQNEAATSGTRRHPSRLRRRMAASSRRWTIFHGGRRSTNR